MHVETGQVYVNTRLCVPYPSPVWAWRSVLSFPWRHRGHINQLEFGAFLVYIRFLANQGLFQGHRLVHVFDSRVVACLVAKGRSSARRMNRLCRRIAAVLLAGDLYVVPLWTVSGWNFSDAGSRVWERPVCNNG